jgi:sugar transferase (PEP-CTERM/EpsH1 system associated)
MRDLLFLAHRFPYPPNKGDKIRSFNILRQLSKRFRIHLGCFVDDRDDMRHIGALKAYCVEVFCRPLERTTKIGRGAAGLCRGKSISESCYYDRAMAKWVGHTLDKFDIKDVFVFCSTMGPYALNVPRGARVIIDLVDVDSEKWSAYAKAAGWPLNRLYRYEQRRVLELEKRVASSCGRVLLVSEAEAGLFRSLAPELSTPVCSLENGVDLEYFDPAITYSCPFRPDAVPIVFTGMMDYRANIDAVTWFATEIFPRIRCDHAAAEFWIVGARPVRAVVALERLDGVHVTGAVEDVRPYLARAACVVAPLRVARGIQNKVLEAMAMGKAVVVTPAALEGLKAEPGHEVLRAAEAAEFSEAVSGVISGKWRGTGPAARRLVENEYGWAGKLKGLDEAFP